VVAATRGWGRERFIRELRVHLASELVAFYTTVLLDRHRLRRCSRVPRRLIELHHERVVEALYHRVRPGVDRTAALEEAVRRVRDLDLAVRGAAQQLAAELFFDALRDVIVDEDEDAFWRNVRLAAATER
jgi:hypothetical protein